MKRRPVHPEAIDPTLDKPLFAAIIAPLLVPAPLLLAHEDKNEHDSNR
jgi:hypothetical protein